MLSKVVLSGNLKFIGLGDILQLIGANGSSGELRIITEQAPEPGRIYFSKGNVIHAVCADMTGLDAAYALFGWVDADFEFRSGDPEVSSSITTSRMEIILDGLRMVDDGLTRRLGEQEEKGDDAEKRIPVIKGPLVDYMYVLDEEEYYRGRRIVQQNKFGGWMWVILEGVADIIKETPDGPVKLIKLGPGSFIGGVSSFMYKGNIRKATVKAFTDVQLGVIDSQRLAEEFAVQRPEFREFVLSMDRRRDQVTEMAVEAYLQMTGAKQLLSGRKRLVKQGSGDDRLFRILQGTAVVVHKSGHGYLPLALLKEDDFIGPVPFCDIGHESKNASVYVSEDIQVAPVNPDHLMEGFSSISATLRNLIEGIANSISVTTRVAMDFQKEGRKDAASDAPASAP